MYSTHHERKSVVAERFIRNLKTKIYKYNMTSMSKNVYTDKLDDIVDEYNNTYHGTIKMKSVDVKRNAYIDFEKEVNVKDPKFQVGDNVRIFIEEKGVNKYLIFDSADKNKELLKKYNDVFSGIRDKIKEINSDECDYEKDYMQIKFNSDDNLPLNKRLKFYNITITIKSIFKEDGKLHLQVFYMIHCMN